MGVLMFTQLERVFPTCGRAAAARCGERSPPHPDRQEQGGAPSARISGSARGNFGRWRPALRYMWDGGHEVGAGKRAKRPKSEGVVAEVVDEDVPQVQHVLRTCEV